jgi:phospholipase D3/4
MSSSGIAKLVESIPYDLNLREYNSQNGINSDLHAYSEIELINLIKNSKYTIDFTSMYWSLMKNNPPEGLCLQKNSSKCCSKSCNTTKDKCVDTCTWSSYFTDDDWIKFKSNFGQELINAVNNAINRGIKIRIVESPGFGGKDRGVKWYNLSKNNQVQVRPVQMKDWYGGGIMHAKIWIVDREYPELASCYVGSMNMDWKSIAQVKEMGIVLYSKGDNNTYKYIQSVTQFFDMWWNFSHPDLTGLKIDYDNDTVTSQSSIPGKPPTTIGHGPWITKGRKVPIWSNLNSNWTKGNPLMGGKYDFSIKESYEINFPNLPVVTYNKNNPLKITLNNELGQGYLSGSPDEVINSKRTPDREAIISTIKNAREFVYISVMDLMPSSIYVKESQIWWPQFFNALLHAVYQNHVEVRILISKWPSSPKGETYFLEQLEQLAKYCNKNYNKFFSPGKCGSLKIKRFIMPGWDKTELGKIDRKGKNFTPTIRHPKFPSKSRVNHTKYIVTDKQLNIGTSNWTWGYFFNTAGASVNLTHKKLRILLKKIFLRDWDAYGIENKTLYDELQNNHTIYPKQKNYPNKKYIYFLWVILAILILIAFIIILFRHHKKI